MIEAKRGIKTDMVEKIMAKRFRSKAFSSVPDRSVMAIFL